MKQRFRELIERNRWMKWIPNSLTLCNSLCGFAAILVTLQAYKAGGNPEEEAVIYAISAGLILFAMVFDALDGFAARILNAASLHGVQMDSLADMVTFGVAPATLVAVMAHNMRHFEKLSHFIPISILCAIYLGCAALRLATYNVHAILEKKSGEKFSGLPSPGAAAAICSLVIFFACRDGGIKWILKYLPLYAAFLGLLMVSHVPYIHLAKWLISTKRNKTRLLTLIVVLAIWPLSCIFYNWYVFPVIFINAYVIWGPVGYLAVKLGIVKPRGDFIAQPESVKEEK